TWLWLARAQDFAIGGRDVAAAYRIQAGRDQWLIYRSLAPDGNRSVLGYNTLKSLFCLRMLEGGSTKKIIEIEYSLRRLANEKRQVGDCGAREQANRMGRV